MHAEEAKVELRWYFEEAEGELGLRGQSYEPGLGEPADPHERAHKRLASVARWRKVHARLGALPAEESRFLTLAYTPHVWPGLRDWYELAGVASYLARPADLRDGASLVSRLKGDERTTMHAKAQLRLNAALRRFCEVTHV